MPNSKTCIAVAFLALAACGTEPEGWQEVALPLPEDLPRITYLRRPMPNAWVGTEQYRRLRVEDRGIIGFPFQMGGRLSTNVYLWRDSSDARLYFDELGVQAVVDLNDFSITEPTVPLDSFGTFIGSFVSPEIRDLRFVPASEGGPVDLDS